MCGSEKGYNFGKKTVPAKMNPGGKTINLPRGMQGGAPYSTSVTFLNTSWQIFSKYCDLRTAQCASDLGSTISRAV